MGKDIMQEKVIGRESDARYIGYNGRVEHVLNINASYNLVPHIGKEILRLCKMPTIKSSRMHTYQKRQKGMHGYRM